MRVFWVIFFALWPATASAFCGFYVGGGGADLYNDATQAVLLRHGNQTVLSMQNAYEGPLENFAMVVPVPQVLQEENVKTLDKSLFDKIDRLSAPRLVEYWEQDPCGPQYPHSFGFGGLGLSGIGRGGGGLGKGGSGFVEVRAQFNVAEYDIVVLETNDASTLEQWLNANKYTIPAGAEPYFRPYVQSGMYFFVAKINAKKVTYRDGRAVLSPLRFHYKSDEFSLPIRLGLINSKGTQDLLVYILGQDQRFEVANRPNVTIPTNIDVDGRTSEHFANFYEALFSRTLEENPGAVVTEYAWQASSCDPCPTGMVGSATLSNADLKSLGGDVLGSAGNDLFRWTLTRLHARYGRDEVGEDLVFKRAEPIVGGREFLNDGKIEKGAVPSDTNQFQGRYIIRHEWQGKVTCESPTYGRWGGPPDAAAMARIRDVIVLELRRQALIAQGKDPGTASDEAPYSDAERDAIAFHMRREFGTDAAPSGRDTSSNVAPSANTRGSAPGKGGAVNLATFVREPVLGIEPAEASKDAAPTPAPVAGNDAGPVAALGEVEPLSENGGSPVDPKGCATVDSGVFLAFLALFGMRRRHAR